MGRLKHFVHLGVNMVALSPIFKTANDNPLFGYDVVDFRELNPVYGLPKDLKELTTAAKQEGTQKEKRLAFNFHIQHSIFRYKDHFGRTDQPC